MSKAKIGSSEKKELKVGVIGDGALYITSYDEKRIAEQLVRKKLVTRSKPKYGIQIYHLTPKGRAIARALRVK